MEPSDLVIAPSLPVMPALAVAGPFTSGQYAVHDPVHLEVVAVSGPNQYKGCPAALVSTVTPLIRAVRRASDPADGAPGSLGMTVIAMTRPAFDIIRAV